MGQGRVKESEGEEGQGGSGSEPAEDRGQGSSPTCALSLSGNTAL